MKINMKNNTDKKYTKYSGIQSFNLPLVYLYFVGIFLVWANTKGGETMLLLWFVFAPLMMLPISILPAIFIWLYIAHRVKKQKLCKNKEDITTSLWITLEAYLLTGIVISVILAFIFNDPKFFMYLITLTAFSCVLGCLNSWIFSYFLPE